MQLVRKVLWAVLAAPLAAIVVALAVANRHSVAMKLDPLRPDNPAISVHLPLYGYIFAALVAGMLIGGTLVWLGQGKFRRRLRERTQDAYRWHFEATRLDRESKAPRGSGQNLPVPTTGIRA